MNSKNRKAIPSNRPLVQPRHIKPAVAQLKTAVSAKPAKQPVAPPVYRPQSAPNVLLRKTANGAAVKGQLPIAPAVYRPQQTPKVLQRKSSLIPGQQANQAPRVPVAPPVYRPEAKRIVQPKMVSPQQKPAVHRPNQTALKAVMPPVAHTKTPQAAAIQRKVASPGRFSVVQRAAKRKREEVEYKLDYVAVPDEEMVTYSKHVKMRTRHFFMVLFNAIIEMQSQGGAVAPSMISDHAEAQEAKGFRLGKEPVKKIDAAHLMNGTLRVKSFKVQSDRVKELYTLSAATTMEYQKANIGPDKLIDSQQTKSKNAILGLAVLPPVNSVFIESCVNDYLGALVVALSVDDGGDGGLRSKAREAALAAVKADLAAIKSVVSDIEAELPK